MLTVKTLRFYQEIKQSVSRHCTIALSSLFNVLNHTLDYYRVTTKLPVLHHLHISGPPIISSEPTNRGLTPRDRGTTPALTAAFALSSNRLPGEKSGSEKCECRTHSLCLLSARTWHRRVCGNLPQGVCWRIPRFSQLLSTILVAINWMQTFVTFLTI